VAQEAHVLLLDEPFNGLDRTASLRLGKLLDQLAHEGRLIIASHHDLGTASLLFNDALLLDKTVLGFGPVDEILTPTMLDSAFTTTAQAI
jgi:ABC-type Mn2+/Zn2+ transport system ATPase subunit